MKRKVLGGLLGVLGLLMLAGLGVNALADARPPLARFYPQPDRVQAVQGDLLPVLWVSSNQPEVELRIRGIDNNPTPEPPLVFTRVLERAEDGEPYAVAGVNECNEATWPNVDNAGTPADSSDDYGYDSVWLGPRGGVEIEVCLDSKFAPAAYDESNGLAIQIFDPEGNQLASYSLDEVPVPTATPAPNRPPAFTNRILTRRICVDEVAGRAHYLSGGEALHGGVGRARDADHDTLTYALAEDEQDHFIFFRVNNATGAITVSEAGANDSSGLDVEQVYSILLNATDGRGGEATLPIYIQLDLGTASPAGDGQCS